MAIERKNLPYELLFRWGADGKLAGGHVQNREVLIEDGAVIHETVGTAQPIALAGGGAFPLGDVLDKLQADQAVRVDELLAQNTALASERDQLLAVINEQAGRLDAYAEAHPRLIDELTATTTERDETAGKLAQATAELSVKQAERQALLDQLTQLHQELGGARALLTAATAERDAAMAQLAAPEVSP